ncbi:alpha-N-acetylglucosaminidase N-terminal domain-containing protein [Bacteroides intestinalis]
MSGNNINSMAVGLNYYLKYYCLITVSWYVDQPVEMSEVLPQIPFPVEVKARVGRHFCISK